MILGAGCATTPVLEAPSVVLPFIAGDHASYRMAGTDLTLGVRLVQDESGLQRWDRRIGNATAAEVASMWTDPDGSVAVMRDRDRTTWFGPGCTLGWPYVTASKCVGRSESQNEDGTTHLWGPLEATQQSVHVVEDIDWAGTIVPAGKWSIESEILRKGEPPAHAATQRWYTHHSCFPAKIIEDFDDAPFEWMLVYSSCQGVTHGDLAAAVAWAAGDGRQLPSPERQPIAACTGAIATNATELLSGLHFDCPLFEAFGVFWLVPGQGLRVTADWGGGPTAGMSLEVDGVVDDATTPPIVIETTAFSVSPDQAVIRLSERGLPNTPGASPRLDRPVTITLEGFATG